MLVDRCWICLEQPAVTKITLRDGKEYPACDICAADHGVRTPIPGADSVPDEVWARIVQDLQ